MEDKLLQYGFSKEQAEQLIKGKKLNVTHGEYSFKNGMLQLKRYADKSVECFTFNDGDCLEG